MKKIVLGFCFLLVSVASFAQQPNSVILLLNFGQSNSVGRAVYDPANVIPPAPGTYWYKQSTNSLEPLVDGIGEGISHATDYSMNPMLGKRIKELTGYDVIIVPAGVGNTNIVSWMKEDNTLYPRAKKLWEDAINYCQAHNIAVVNKYAHWLQGENDAGVLETDGYYVMLSEFIDDIIADLGVEKVFATRIGYDPNYASAANSEKIMKAQKILGFNHPHFIMASYAPPTFTVTNQKMLWDLSHYSLLGQNQVAEDIAQAIQYYRTTGNKISLTENVPALQSVTNGAINLTPDWLFNFNNNLDDANHNASVRHVARGWLPPPTTSFTSDGVIINGNSGLALSRPFSSATFTVEIRLKMNSQEAWSAVLGKGDGGNKNKLIVYHNAATSASGIQFSTTTDIFYWDLGTAVNMSAYHTLKFSQSNGVLKFFVDGIQQGADMASNGKFKMSIIGAGGASHTTDMDGVIDFFRIKNAVDVSSTLPVKFKSFKATNIK